MGGGGGERDKTGALLARLIRQEDRSTQLLSVRDEAGLLAVTQKDINTTFGTRLRQTDQAQPALTEQGRPAISEGGTVNPVSVGRG